MSVIETAVNLTEDERKLANKDYPGPSGFVHLHNHTLFSPLDGIATPDEYFSAASHLGNPAFCITDHGSMAAVPDAFWAAKRHKVKYLPGCEIYFSQEHLELTKLKEEDPNFSIKQVRPDYSKNEFTIEDLAKEERASDFRRNRHLSVIAMNMVGYRNLIRMTTEAWEIGFYYKPRIWFEQIEKYQEGLICLSGCLNGPVCHNLRKSAFWNQIAKGNIKTLDRNFAKKKKVISLNITRSEAKTRSREYAAKALSWITKFRNLLGDRFYLEMQMPGSEIPFGKEAFEQIAQISDTLKIPAVISNDCHYLNRPDFKVQKCLMAIDQGLKIDDPNLFHVNSDEQFFKSRAQLRKTFIEGGYSRKVSIEKFEECCDNTVKLSERCTGFKPDLSPKLPAVPNANEKLTTLVVTALKERGLWDKPEKYLIDGQMVTYRELATIELKRYISKGFASYFLIIRDLIQYNRGQGWPIGPGRGSAGGSLVCYLLGIHDIDPIAWGLSSVRFMGDSRGGNLLKVTMD